ncbi:hypothetical protein C8R44DRAFT_871812 [Mycena epipterygia]|nr:hypothetical protein C8R44DRAFT_871812 [Mycena epipterygia]
MFEPASSPSSEKSPSPPPSVSKLSLAPDVCNSLIAVKHLRLVLTLNQPSAPPYSYDTTSNLTITMRTTARTRSPSLRARSAFSSPRLRPPSMPHAAARCSSLRTCSAGSSRLPWSSRCRLHYTQPRMYNGTTPAGARAPSPAVTTRALCPPHLTSTGPPHLTPGATPPPPLPPPPPPTPRARAGNSSASHQSNPSPRSSWTASAPRARSPRAYTTVASECHWPVSVHGLPAQRLRLPRVRGIEGKGAGGAAAEPDAEL